MQLEKVATPTANPSPVLRMVEHAAPILANEPVRHYRIGVVRAAVTSRVSALMEEHRSLYAPYEVAAADGQEIEVRVAAQPFSWRHRRRYDVTVNNRVQFQPARRAELLPYVEWAINWEVPRLLPHCLHLHASALAIDGMGVILPGASGSGKSTLTAGLVSCGWHYLCDEFAIIDPATMHVQPYPRALCIKKPSFGAIASVGLATHGRHHLKGTKGYVGFISPQQVRPDAVGRACPVNYVIFPKYVSGAAPQLKRLHRAEAAFALHSVCFNLLDCRTPALDVIARLVRNAECFELISGELRATCQVVQNLVQARAAQSVRSLAHAEVA